jgi:hypothetical protein
LFELPQDQFWEFNNAFHYELKADDFFGINNWWINNTLHFDIDSNGVLTNKILLERGNYWLEIRAYDPLSNFCICTIKIIIIQKISLLDITTSLNLIGAPLVVIDILGRAGKLKINGLIYRQIRVLPSSSFKKFLLLLLLFVFAYA